MALLEETLRFSARDTLGLKDGDYFDSMITTNQAKAVKQLLSKLYEDSFGDFDYVLFALDR